jgi:hypothetical protein
VRSLTSGFPVLIRSVAGFSCRSDPALRKAMGEVGQR